MKEKAQLMCLGVFEVAQGLVAICTLGFYAPRWTAWLLFTAFGEEDAS